MPTVLCYVLCLMFVSGFESHSFRHTVWVAEKLRCIPAKIARNRRNSAIPSLKPDRRKCPAERHRQAMERFSLEGPCTVPVSTTPSGSAIDDSAKAT
jgi:hypothetical protein